MAGIRSTHDPLHYKLVTKFRKQYVVHNRGEPTEKRWKQERPLGEGGQGIVYLQKSKSPNTQLRAVKKIPQQLMKANKVDIKRELHTLIEVSDVSIGSSLLESQILGASLTLLSTWIDSSNSTAGMRIKLQISSILPWSSCRTVILGNTCAIMGLKQRDWRNQSQGNL